MYRCLSSSKLLATYGLSKNIVLNLGTLKVELLDPLLKDQNITGPVEDIFIIIAIKIIGKIAIAIKFRDKIKSNILLIIIKDNFIFAIKILVYIYTLLKQKEILI